MSQSLALIVDTTKRPKHVIFIGLDAGRYDYLERYPLPHIQSLIENGVSFRNAITSNFPINTAPGFASLSTGKVSKEHGIYSSRPWYNKKTGELHYFFDDQKGSIDLKAPTLCDTVKAINPEAMVASVSAKDRPALLLVGNNADLVAYSYRWSKPTREMYSRGQEGDAFAGAGVHEDYYFWAERPNHQLPSYLQDMRLPRVSDWKGEGFFHPHQETGYTPGVDTFVMDAALEIIKNEQPYLMYVTMVCMDVVGHEYTTDSLETKAALKEIDNEIGKMIQLLKEMDRYEDTLIVISADHAMAAKPQSVSVMDELEKRGYNDIIDNILYILVGCGAGLWLKDASQATIKKTILAIQDLPYIEGAWYKYDTDAPWFIKRAAFHRAPDIGIVAQGDAGTIPAGSTAPTYFYRHGAPYPADANIMLVAIYH